MVDIITSMQKKKKKLQICIRTLLISNKLLKLIFWNYFNVNYNNVYEVVKDDHTLV